MVIKKEFVGSLDEQSGVVIFHGLKRLTINFVLTVYHSREFRYVSYMQIIPHLPTSAFSKREHCLPHTRSPVSGSSQTSVGGRWDLFSFHWDSGFVVKDLIKIEEGTRIRRIEYLKIHLFRSSLAREIPLKTFNLAAKMTGNIGRNK